MKSPAIETGQVDTLSRLRSAPKFAALTGLVFIACSTPNTEEATTENEGAMDEMTAISAPSTPDPADLAAIDTVVADLYDVISGPAGPRDWERFEALFAPDGHLMPSGPSGEGGWGVSVMAPRDYAEQVGPFFANNPFFEVEMGSVTEIYGNIAHRFSSYASYRNMDEEPFTHGINSIQLIDDGSQWRVLSIFWQDAASAGPIPERYLGR